MKCISQEVFYKINNNYIKNSVKRTLEPRIVGASGSLMREQQLCTDYTICLMKCISQEVFYKINNNYIKIV
jgi:hypothetical protein